ncbi:MAG: hypothetical protein H0W27_04185 [Actinobacteria bacterium]|nr:hypothetical protein [Actinomycetota bacterium]
MVMRRSFLLVAVLVAALLAPVGAQAGSASIALSPQVGPPTTKVMVSGTGFAPNEHLYAFRLPGARGTNASRGAER